MFPTARAESRCRKRAESNSDSTDRAFAARCNAEQIPYRPDLQRVGGMRKKPTSSRRPIGRFPRLHQMDRKLRETNRSSIEAAPQRLVAGVGDGQIRLRMMECPEEGEHPRAELRVLRQIVQDVMRASVDSSRRLGPDQRGE